MSLGECLCGGRRFLWFKKLGEVPRNKPREKEWIPQTALKIQVVSFLLHSEWRKLTEPPSKCNCKTGVIFTSGFSFVDDRQLACRPPPGSGHTNWYHLGKLSELKLDKKKKLLLGFPFFGQTCSRLLGLLQQSEFEKCSIEQAAS